MACSNRIIKLTIKNRKPKTYKEEFIQMTHHQSGKLYICGTPIGNLEDITLRCLKILRQVDLIAAEDTRHTRILLDRYQIHKQLISYHEFNKEKKAPLILQFLQNGQDVALVSDAGMPGICDPGYELINLAIENQFQVIPVPGATALTAALAVSGFDMSRFIFEGFIPKRKTEREQFFSALKEENRTMIFYDSPFRVKETLKMIEKTMGNRKIVMTRELTKKFEEIKRGNISDMINEINAREIKGEITLVMEGCHRKNASHCTADRLLLVDEIKKKMKTYLKKGYYNKDIVLLITKEYDISKNRVYQMILENQEKG